MARCEDFPCCGHYDESDKSSTWCPDPETGKFPPITLTRDYDDYDDYDDYPDDRDWRMAAQRYELRFTTYSGMSISLLKCDNLQTVRDRAARKIWHALDEIQPVTILKPGREWEFETPEDAFMISDGDGYLRIIDHTETGNS